MFKDNMRFVIILDKLLISIALLDKNSLPNQINLGGRAKKEKDYIKHAVISDRASLKVDFRERSASEINKS